MAAVEKYKSGAVSYELRHNTREASHPTSNKEIDSERTHLNYHLDEHGETAREAKNYYNERMREIYCYGRSDINTICQWICTAPKDLPKEQEEEFFRETYDYLNSMYGKENCIQAVVHNDEGVKNRDGEIIEGQAHLHYLFIPVVKNNKFDPEQQAEYFKKLERYTEKKNAAKSAHQVLEQKPPVRKACTYEEKVCADQVIRRRTLQEFHPKYQEWLDEHGVNASVYTGITGGSNRTVEELKEKTKDELLEQERALNRELKAKIEEHKNRNKVIDVWGRDRSVDVWGREREDKTWSR